LLGQILWEPASEALLRGQSGRVRRWLSRIDDGVVAKSAGLSMAATWAAVSAGDYPSAARWEHVTAGLIERGQVDPPQIATVETSFRLLAALAGRNGWWNSAQIAAESGEAMPPDSLMRVFADLLQGWLLVLAGDRESGLILLDRVRAVARVHDMATTATEAGSLCALMHCIRGDEARVAELVAQARATWEPRDREGALMTRALLSAATACAGSSADSAGSDDAPIRLSLDLAPSVVAMVPWFEPMVHSVAAVQLAHTDGVAAAGHLRQAQESLLALPDSPFLDEMVQWARGVLNNAGRLSVLSPAERRVWDLLQTRMTIREIGQCLFVSSETVKSHTAAIYRKLGITSRRQAQDLGESLQMGHSV
jgi:LuxR family maltose regulon positive regulatory protein